MIKALQIIQQRISQKILDNKNLLPEIKELRTIYNNLNTIVSKDPSKKLTQEYMMLVETLGFAYSEEGNYTESNKFLTESLEVYYNPLVSHTYGMNKLFLSDVNGFKYYHNRYKKGDGAFKIPNFPMERIRCISRLNKMDSLLVLNEQGIGDEILFSRCIPIIANIVNDITVKVRPELLEYFKLKFKDVDNLTLITKAMTQDAVNNFTSWGMMGDLFASMEPELMFYQKNEFKIPDEPIIGISTTHGALDKTEETPYSLKIKSKRGIPKEFFLKTLKEYSIIDFSYTESDYPEPKDFWETYQNLKNENINLVITIDSSFGHFTADMGIPTVIVYDGYFDWRWRLQKSGRYLFNNLIVLHKNELRKYLNSEG